MSIAGCASWRLNAELDQSGSIARYSPLRIDRTPRMNDRESTQRGAPVRWMLGFMRAIYAHVNAVVRSNENGGL